LNLVDKKLQDKKIWWNTAFAPETPTVYADFHQIQQVIINLLFNAIDAMEEGGQLLISAAPYNGSGKGYAQVHHAWHDSAGKARFVEVVIQDSGIGIKPEDLENIFDPFFTTKPQGTGLGLAIVYRIISAHGGEIAVSSTLGQGTSFKFLLPTEEVKE
jgi:signal transduction histidine kinase